MRGTDSISDSEKKTGKKPKGLASALRSAKDYIDDKERLAFLLNEAKRKTRENKNALKDAWRYMNVFLRLLRSWKKGEYKNVSLKTVLMAVAAVIYLVNPFDVIPDFLGIIGFSDDAALIAYVFRLVGEEVERFTKWEKGKKEKRE